ncbi:condensation domain-containing protein, partial [Streptomyces yangpuensis]|uniref:hypothetical protein n=1 Tax=Streptomyces yangpuensis TaxID=1648182 RepID=UPI00366477B4
MTELLPARADSAASFPMTETQQALMIGRGEAVEMGGIGCYGYFEWERPDLDPERFAAAWRTVVARHDMLRAIGGTDGTQWVPCEPLALDITVVDLRPPFADAAREHHAELCAEL